MLLVENINLLHFDLMEPYTYYLMEKLFLQVLEDNDSVPKPINLLLLVIYLSSEKNTLSSLHKIKKNTEKLFEITRNI